MDIKTRYFDWLRELVDDYADPIGNPDRSHSFLLEQLFMTPFEWFVRNDDNREEDGLLLRDQFCDEIGSWHNSPFIFEPCSVLEMMIGLSHRLEFESSGTEIEGTESEWFWRMVQNANLFSYVDSRYLEKYSDAEEEVRRIIETIVNRGYKANGVGGFFPLAHPRRDQRRTELWNQASAYLLENSSIGS